MLKTTIYGLIIVALFGFVVFSHVVYAQTTDVSLSINPASSKTLLPGTAQVVSVIFQSGGHDVDAVDVVIAYDESKVTITDLVTTDLFSTYPLKSAEGGLIKVSGLSDLTSPINTSGTLFTFTMNIKDGAAGSTTLTILDGSDAGSHVAEHGTANDILGGVTNGNYTIIDPPIATVTPAVNGNTPTPTPKTATPTATPTPLASALPATGSVGLTYAFTSLLGFLLVVGVFLCIPLYP